MGGLVENTLAQQGGAHALFSQALSSMGGYEGILGKLNQAGLGNVVSSWVGTGSNLPVTPQQIEAALGDQHIQQLATSLGIPVDQVSAFLAQHLPTAVDQASPNGTLPAAPPDASGVPPATPPGTAS